MDRDGLVTSLANLANNRVRSTWRRESQVLAKRTPSVTVIAMQAGHVGPAWHVQVTTSPEIGCPGSTVEQDELGAWIAQHKAALSFLVSRFAGMTGAKAIIRFAMRSRRP